MYSMAVPTPRQVFVLVVTTALALPGATSARQRTVDTGDRIRIVAPGWFGHGPVKYLSTGRDSIYLEQHGQVFAVPLTAVEEIDVSESSRPMIPEGLLVGSIGATAFGAITALSACQNSSCKGKLIGAFIGTGALAGILFGASHAHHRWVPGTTPGLGPRRSTIGIGPDAEGGWGVRVTILHLPL